jgi:valyl-tRNA synthetase
MYHIKYQIKGTDDFVVVSTTRPETMFADKVAFVNPTDDRYKDLVGKTIINPANNEEMIVMADEYVSLDKGSGVMKCTPAHDFNDYELGIKYDLEFISAFNEDGTLNELGGEYEGIDRLEVRKLLVKKFEEMGILEKEEHKGIAHISDRSGTPVEPMLSEQ